MVIHMDRRPWGMATDSSMKLPGLRKICTGSHITLESAIVIIVYLQNICRGTLYYGHGAYALKLSVCSVC